LRSVICPIESGTIAGVNHCLPLFLALRQRCSAMSHRANSAYPDFAKSVKMTISRRFRGQASRHNARTQRLSRSNVRAVGKHVSGLQRTFTLQRANLPPETRPFAWSIDPSARPRRIFVSAPCPTSVAPQKSACFLRSVRNARVLRIRSSQTGVPHPCGMHFCECWNQRTSSK